MSSVNVCMIYSAPEMGEIWSIRCHCVAGSDTISDIRKN